MHLEISSFKRIVVLTGAGISAESGISTFRDAGGLWEKHRIEDVATPEAFYRDPKLVWRFYSMRRTAAASAKPNAAHLALAGFAQICADRGTGFTLVTQNVDCLHERANLEATGKAADPCRLLAMHGTLSRSRCARCGAIFSDPFAWLDSDGKPVAAESPALRLVADGAPLIDASKIQRNEKGIPLSPCCGGTLRPHIVWFGEMPLNMDQILGEISQCDLFVTVGTSGLVYPAAGLIEQAKIAGATTACLNMEPIPQQGMVDFYFEGPATQTVTALLKLG